VARSELIHFGAYSYRNWQKTIPTERSILGSDILAVKGFGDLKQIQAHYQKLNGKQIKTSVLCTIVITHKIIFFP
jgi:hypothetical protein